MQQSLFTVFTDKKIMIRIWTKLFFLGELLSDQEPYVFCKKKKKTQDVC